MLLDESTGICADADLQSVTAEAKSVFSRGMARSFRRMRCARNTPPEAVQPHSQGNPISFPGPQ